MAKITLADVSNLLGNPTSAANTLNNNNTTIETAFDNTLSRDGSIPNQMEADIDLNGNDLLNVENTYTNKLYVEGERIVPSDAVNVGNFMDKGQYDPQSIGGDVFDRKKWGEFDTKSQAIAANVPATITLIHTNGGVTKDDGLGGDWTTTNNGSLETFVSGDGRTWYFSKDVGESRLTDLAKASFASAADGFNLNIGRDKLNYSVVANLIRLTGDAAYNLLYGVQREIQYMAADQVNGYWYTTHDNDQVPNLSVITRYPFSGSGVNRTQNAVSLPSEEFGHQGLACETTTSGRLWSTDGTNKLAAIRFDFVDGLGPQNKEQYILFQDQGNIPGSWNNDVSCFNNLSDKWLIAHGKIVGEETVVFRFWDKAELIAGGPGDYTNAWKKQVYAKGLYTSSTYPVQGSTSPDDHVLIACSGGNGYDPIGPRRMYKYDIDSGELLEADHNVMIGAIEASTDGSGISYEPEGMTTITVNGVKRVCIGIRSGSSLTPSTFRVLMLGANERTSVNIPASGQAIVYSRLGLPIGGVEINTSAVKALAYGTGLNYRLGTSGTDKWEVSDTDSSWRPMLGDTYSLGSNSGISRRILNVMSKMYSYTTTLFRIFGTGTPEGVITADIGSVYTRTDGVLGTTHNIKETGTGNTGWNAVQTLKGGTTALRPTTCGIYYRYFDTTLGKPIWNKGTVATPVWVDATGTTV